MALGKKPVENIVENGENAGYAGNQHYLQFPQCFLPHRRKNSII